MISVILSIYHIKLYVIIFQNEYYTQYVNNIKMVQTNKWLDKAVAQYHIGTTSSIDVIKQCII